MVSDKAGIAESEVQGVTGPATVRDHDQLFRTQSGKRPEPAIDRRGVPLDRLVRARINIVNGLPGHSDRPELPRILFEVLGHSFVLKAADEDVAIAPGGALDLGRDRKFAR